MAEEQQETIGIAKRNLANAWANPVTKIGVGVGVIAVIVCSAAAISILRGKTSFTGKADGEGYSVSDREPRGEVDPSTAKAVEAKADERAAKAREDGQSYVGPFVYDGGGPVKYGKNTDTFKEGGQATAQQVAPIFAGLRAKAAEYDLSEQGSDRGRQSTGVSYGQGGSVNGGQRAGQYAGSRTSSQQLGYGLSEEAFKQVSGQLAQVGTSVYEYKSLPGGVLTAQPQAHAPHSQKQSVTSAEDGTSQPRSVAPTRTGQPAREEIAARAGDVCAATPEASINTDYNVPAFFQIHDCGILTGARMRGQIQKTPDDFFITFSALTLDPRKGYKLIGGAEGISVNSKTDSAGVADDVDRHWISRLGASSILALSRVERSFMNARGSQTLNTGTSTSVTIDPLSSEEKQRARIAGLLEGGSEVIARDLGYGVNRQATMSMNKTTAIGIQFTSDVKVVPNE